MIVPGLYDLLIEVGFFPAKGLEFVLIFLLLGPQKIDVPLDFGFFWVIDFLIHL